MTYTYCGITADSALWKALDMTEYGDRPFAEGPSRSSASPSDGSLVEARVASGSDGDAALVWLIQERRKNQQHADALTVERQKNDALIHAARINRQAAEMNLEAAKRRG